MSVPSVVTELVPANSIKAIATPFTALVADPKAREKAKEGSAHDYSLFMQLRQDFRREEQHEVETIYCMDFSEIFPYLHPQGDPDTGHVVRPRDAFLVEFAINTSTNKMVLPPAAVVELLQHIAYLEVMMAKEAPSIARELRELKASEFVPRAQQALASAGKTRESLREFMIEISSKWSAVDQNMLAGAAGRSSHSEAARRLGRLLKRLKPLTDFIDPADLDIDDLAYRRSLDFLTTNRPLRPAQNHRDAVNFAFTYYANSLSFKKPVASKTDRRYFVLVTRGWPFASGLGPLEFPLDPVRDEGNFARAGLVRDIEYVVARTLLERAISSVSKRIELSIAMVQQNSLFSRLLERVEKSLRDNPQSPPTLEAIEQIIVKECGASLLEYHALRTYRSEIMREFQTACEVLGTCRGERPGHEEEGVPVLQGAGKVLSDSNPDMEGLTAAKSDTARARAWLTTQLNLLRKAGIATYAAGPERHYAKFKIAATEQQNTLFEVRALPSNDLLATVDVRPHAFLVECEHLPGRLNWFCRIAKYMIRQVSFIDASEPNGIPRTTKLFSGLQLISTDDECWDYGELDDKLAVLDDADELWRLACARFQGLPKFIRISTDLFDLWYDFLDPKFQKGRTGIISHVGLPDPMAYFIVRCQRHLVRHAPLAQELSSFLSKHGFPAFEAAYV